MNISLPALGSLLAQRFRIEEQIGAGGMGTVFRAHDLKTAQPVAIKFLQSHGTPQEAERFAREAQLLAELRHPHIVSYIDHGINEVGQPYLIMEWLEGEDLSQLLQHRKLSFSDCAALLLGASAGLAESHQRGIVHRDLSPPFWAVATQLALRAGKVFGKAGSGEPATGAGVGTGGGHVAPW